MTGADKKLNFPVLKQIRISDNQAKNWNPKAIRSFLDGINKNSDTNKKASALNYLKQLYEFMSSDNVIVKSFDPEIKETIIKIKEMIQ